MEEAKVDRFCNVEGQTEFADLDVGFERVMPKVNLNF